MKLTFYLVVVNFVFFILQSLSPLVTETLGLVTPVALSGAYWQFITYMFMHANPFHIFINMFVLLIFGIAVEDSLGARKYLFLYFVSGIGSAVLYMLLTIGAAEAILIGASGAVFGVVAAYGFLFPKNYILVFFIPVPAMIAVILLALAEILFGVFGLQAGVANFGHLGGMITASALMLIWRYQKKKIPVEDRTFEFIWE
ncbi:MAG: rhomboid family intramembrane serine protease [Nanoarchaeota archaeon]|nr:rhomboid family intramembrane serine protease [Nanoarchaeota archaeon]